MTCQDKLNISFRFPRNELEIRPYTVDFRIDRNELDFIDAKFSKEIGDLFEEKMQEGGAWSVSVLRKPQPVEVKIDGEVTHRMFWRPDYVTYGETNTWIEFHDPQEILKYDIVDYKIDMMTVREVYTKIIEEANITSSFHDGVISGIEFQIPNGAETTAGDFEQTYGPGGLPVKVQKNPNSPSGYDIIRNLWRDYDNELGPEPQYSPISETVFNNLDIQNKTALEAIYELNERLGFVSWVDNEGVMNIGFDFIEPKMHYASSNDNRVWVYRDPNITPPGSPVKMAVVNGGSIDAPNQTEEEGALESAWEFVNPTNDHEDDLIAQGVAQRPDITDGKIVSVDEPNLSRDALESRAQQVLANEATNNNAGSVKIDVEKSGIEMTDWRNVEVGDFITLIPSEDDDCDTIEQDKFLISGVRHDIDGERWDLKLEIQKWKNPQTDTTLRYFSPDSNNYYNKDFEEIYTDS